eukprot:c47826_g1_i1 orf=126-545(+)
MEVMNNVNLHFSVQDDRAMHPTDISTAHATLHKGGANDGSLSGALLQTQTEEIDTLNKQTIKLMGWLHLFLSFSVICNMFNQAHFAYLLGVPLDVERCWIYEGNTLNLIDTMDVSLQEHVRDGMHRFAMGSFFLFIEKN